MQMSSRKWCMIKTMINLSMWKWHMVPNWQCFKQMDKMHAHDVGCNGNIWQIWFLRIVIPPYMVPITLNDFIECRRKWLAILYIYTLLSYFHMLSFHDVTLNYCMLFAFHICLYVIMFIHMTYDGWDDIFAVLSM